MSLLLSSALLASVPTYRNSADVAGAGAAPAPARPLPPNSSRAKRLVLSGCKNLGSPPPTHPPPPPRAALLRRCEKKKAMDRPSTATVSSGSSMAGTSLDAFFDPCDAPVAGGAAPAVLGRTRAGYVGWSCPAGICGGGGTGSVGKNGGGAAGCAGWLGTKKGWWSCLLVLAVASASGPLAPSTKQQVASRMGSSSCGKNWRGDGIVMEEEASRTVEEEAESKSCVCMAWCV